MDNKDLQNALFVELESNIVAEDYENLIFFEILDIIYM